jgi:hypothetical protein
VRSLKYRAASSSGPKSETFAKQIFRTCSASYAGSKKLRRGSPRACVAVIAAASVFVSTHQPYSKMISVPGASAATARKVPTIASVERYMVTPSHEKKADCIGAVATHPQFVNRRLLFEIDRHQTQVRGQLNTRRAKTSPLPCLGGRMIYLEDVESRCKFRSAIKRKSRARRRVSRTGATSRDHNANIRDIRRLFFLITSPSPTWNVRLPSSRV